MTIATYIRCSTSKQETVSQRNAIEGWIQHQGYRAEDIAEYTDSAVSGGTMDRPAFKRLMNDVEAGKIECVVTFELSRFSRDLVDSLNIMRVFATNRVRVEVPGQGIKPFASALDQFMTAVQGFAAAQERENVRARTRAGMQAARQRGVRLGAPAGNKYRAGKLKTLDPARLDRFRRLAGVLSLCDLAAEMKVSVATVTRWKRRYLKPCLVTA